MNKNKLSIYFAFIAILSFLTFFISIVQKSYFNLVNPIKEVESNKLLTPIDPKLNLEIINDIEIRPENIDDSLINFSFEESLATISGQHSKE